MSATKTRDKPERSGLIVPPAARRFRWCSWFRAGRSRHLVFRAGVFVVGLGLILLAAAMWLISALLAAPPAFAGLWLWAHEFHWGHRLLLGFVRRVRSLWSRAKARPMRWCVITLGGITAAWAAYWAWGRYGPW